MSLANYFKHRSIEIAGFYTGEHGFDTNIDFKLYNDINSFVNENNIIFLTVTDRAISEVWSRLEKTDINKKVICHCSGSLSSEIFINADKHNAYCCSVHPILPFETPNVSISEISKAYFTMEGNKNAVDIISKLLEKCKNPYYIIDSKNKAKYHCAACFASNFVIAVCEKAVQLMTECGFGRNEALNAMTPLIKANVNNICTKGTITSLTGPVERNDLSTLEKHMQTLSDTDKALYKELTKVLTDIAKEKHRDRDYTNVEEFLL